MKTSKLLEIIKEFELEDAFMEADEDVIRFEKDHITFQYPEHANLSLVLARHIFFIYTDTDTIYENALFYVQPNYHYGIGDSKPYIEGYVKYYEICNARGGDEFYYESDDIPPLFIEKAKEAGWM